MDAFLFDLKIAARRLAKSRSFTAFALITIASGVAAPAAIYSVLYALLLVPPNIRDVGRVVNVYHSWPQTDAAYLALSAPDFRAFQERQTAFSDVMGWAPFRANITGRFASVSVAGEAVTGNYFQFVGAHPAMGRLLVSEDDKWRAVPVVVVSRDLWARQLESAGDIVGSTISVNGVVATVVGVASDDFRGLSMPNLMPTKVWVPLSTARRFGFAHRYNTEDTDAEERWLLVKARLRPQVSFTQAQTQVSTIDEQLDVSSPIGRGLAYRYPAAMARRWVDVPTSTIRLQESVGQFAIPLAMTVMTAVTLALFVVCANLASLMLARGVARRNELVTAISLGAPRWRLVRLLVIESALLGIAGLGLAGPLVGSLTAAIAWRVTQIGPVALEVSPRVNWQVVVVAIAAALAAVGLFGAIPALQLTRNLHERRLVSEAFPSVRRGQRNLIAMQVAVSVVLLSALIAIIADLWFKDHRDLGFESQRVALVRIDAASASVPEARFREELGRIASAANQWDPRIASIAIATGLPVGTPLASAAITRGGIESTSARSPVQVDLLVANASIFATLGIPIIQGRPFGDKEQADTIPLVVSATAARAVFGTERALGQLVTLRLNAQEPSLLGEIVGIASDTDTDLIGSRSRGLVYVPFSRVYWPAMSIIARTRIDPTGVETTLLKSVRLTDEHLPVVLSGTGLTLLNPSDGALRSGAWLLGILGLTALALGMIGLNGVMTEIVLSRTREFGVRMACGATAGAILRLILVQALRPVLEGVAIAAAVVGLALTLLSSVLFRIVTAASMLWLVGIPAIVIGVAVLATMWPAWRASMIAPAEALRD
jgi:putative ABC transport system permease protein